MIDHSQLNNVDRGYTSQETWSSFACHAWMQDTARLIVCTDKGEILVCENSGEYYTFVEKVDSARIKCVTPYNRSFIIGWSNGMFTFYERYEDQNQGISTYKRLGKDGIQT